MTNPKQKLASLAVAGVLVTSLAAAPSAFAGGTTGGTNCNSGRGNGSEGCDPGNSGAHNYGGDEGGPIHGGTGAP